MDNEPQVPHSSAAPLDQAVGETATATPTTPWEDYLTGKKVAPERFLATLAKGAIPIPDQQARDRIADALLSKPERLRRFLALLRASESSSNTLAGVVFGLAEDTIRRSALIAIPEPFDPSAYQHAIASWLENKPKKPLKTPELNILFLLLRFGRARGLLDEDAILESIASAVAKSAKPRKKRAPGVKAAPTPSEVLLNATPAAPVLAALVAGSKSWAALVEERNRQLRLKEEELSRLRIEMSEMTGVISALQGDVASWTERHARGEARIAELEKLIVDMSDGWQHKLDQLQGRIRGVMQGQLTRWLRTALDAARSNPPFLKAVEERLEDALRVTDGELEWLQRSD